MIDLAVLKGSSFVVLGLARSGLATGRALKAAGIDFICWDDNAASRRSLADMLAQLEEICLRQRVPQRAEYPLAVSGFRLPIRLLLREWPSSLLCTHFVERRLGLEQNLVLLLRK